MEIKTISASKMNSYDLCPYAFMLRYKLGLIQPDSNALRIGSLWHKGLYLFHSGQSEESVLEEIKSEIFVDKTNEELNLWGEIRPMLEFYFNNKYEKDNIALEEKFSVTLDDLPPIVGILDRRMEDEVLDYKTTSKDYIEADIIKNNQTMLYALIHFIRTGEIPLVSYYIVNKAKIKRKGYKPQIIQVKPTEEQLEAFKAKIYSFYDNVLNDRFEPKFGSQCYWCSFRKNCEYVKKKS